MPHPPIRSFRPSSPRFGDCVRRLLLLNLVLLQPLFSLAGPLPASPEQTLRQLTLALLRGDRQAVLALTRGDPEAAALGELEPAPERARRLEDDPDDLVIQLLRPYEAGGQRLEGRDPRTLPPGATALEAATLLGGQTQIWRLVRGPEGWQADLRWAARARAMAAQGETLEPPGSPEWVARRLTFALLLGDRQQALPLLLPGADPAVVVLGAADQPDPSGHLLALAEEMPLVRLDPGEAAVLPDGQVAKASLHQDRLLVLGLFGVSEIPFLLEHRGGRWRAVPQPWLPLLLR
ncbi:hypothetical protein [Cyanobium sp. NIES-981]|uniref:hypothetical protein n=1 Tax=Cyanobium sp. NIES-981 TaxID=1851505 RepID=UPI0007DD9888|nr:hypothetical protein [Cyanobium sp. NIES-981]SBO42091.1 protein of unknown function [Cyanobium sp. NIES-981]